MEQAARERRIEVSRTLEELYEHVRDVLRSDAGTVLPARVQLGVDLGGGAELRQEAQVDIGPVDEAQGALSAPVRWVPSAHTRVLPAFVGTIEAAPCGLDTTLTLRGSYRPPLGRPGAYADGLIGRRLAIGSMGRLIEEMAQRLSAEIARRLAGGWRPPPAPALKAVSPSEAWLG